MSRMSVRDSSALEMSPAQDVAVSRTRCPRRRLDDRFADRAWCEPPFRRWAEAQIALEARWRAAASQMLWLPHRARQRLEYLGGLGLNALAPANFPWTNPQVIAAAQRTGGMNFLAGAARLAEDFTRALLGDKPSGVEAFRLGQSMAATPGAVVFRNELMEVIQYAPATAGVRREPVLITPAWMTKYYILDLTPPESLVRFLVGEGFSVFIISWKNPGADLAETSLEDYRRDGVVKAIDVVASITPGERLHVAGYCLGGLAVAIAAAAMTRDGDDRLASLTLFATQTDFEESGDLMLFVDPLPLAWIEAALRRQGYFDPRPLAGFFFGVRARERLFAMLAERYLLGEASPPTARDAWLADPTRLPARMFTDYLQRLVLENSLARGAYQVEGAAISLSGLRVPVFAVGAEQDAIAPWCALYRSSLAASADATFVLAAGDHVTAVVNPPGQAGGYRLVRCDPQAPPSDPDAWAETATPLQGSWWPEWARWLARHSAPERRPSPYGRWPRPGAALGPAPGTYVFET